MLHPDHAAARQFFQRATHGVAVDAELAGQVRLGGQAGAWRQGAGIDVALQVANDLPPQCHTVAPQHRMSREVVRLLWQLHGYFIHAVGIPGKFSIDASPGRG